MWVETVTEGGKRFVAAWTKEGVSIARKTERQRDWKSCYRTRKRRTCEATPIGLVHESKESILYGRKMDRDLRRD